MEAGIVGLPNVGKSTLFNALTESKSAASENYPFCTIEPNEGVITVPDDRLEKITQFITPQKVIPAIVKLVDIAGLVEGASKGEGRGNQFLSHIRSVDAIVQVVRCFEDDSVIHVAGKVDPMADIETIEMELMLADIETLQNAQTKATKTARSGNKEAIERLAVIAKCLEHLESETPLRKLELTEIEDKSIRSFGLMTLKPLLYVANVSEDDVAGTSALTTKVREYAASVGAGFAAVCASIESELAEVPAEERGEMLDAYGLKEPALNALAREAYKTLGLQSYFTAGEKEVRAWTVPIGTAAPQAAGVIHTDFEKSFVRVNVFTLDDLVEHNSEDEIKNAGKLRVEGKAYIVQDGDICHFLCN